MQEALANGLRAISLEVLTLAHPLYHALYPCENKCPPNRPGTRMKVLQKENGRHKVAGKIIESRAQVRNETDAWPNFSGHMRKHH